MQCEEADIKNVLKAKILKNQEEAFNILPTIIKKYGRFSYKRFAIWLLNNTVDGYYNHISYNIEGFIHKDSKTYIKIFWQLDNADGEEVVEMPKPYNSAKVEINTNLHFYVDSDDIYQAIINLKF